MELLERLAGTGIVGLLLAICLGALYYKDKELAAVRREKDKELADERHARIEDSERYLTIAMSMQKEVITAVGKLADLVEIWEKREAERERSERSERMGRRA